MALTMPTNQRDQLLLGAAVVAFLAVGAYWYLMWSPKQTELVALEARADTLDSLNAIAKGQVRRGEVAQLQRQAEEFKRNLDVMRRLVPTANEVPALLEQVSTAARQAGLEISEVAPEGVMQGDQFDTHKYSIGVKGGYHQVGRFLTNVASMQRIVAPINVNLSMPADAQAARNQRAPTVDAKFEIKTFVARTTPAAGAGGAR